MKQTMVIDVDCFFVKVGGKRPRGNERDGSLYTCCLCDGKSNRFNHAQKQQHLYESHTLAEILPKVSTCGESQPQSSDEDIEIFARRAVEIGVTLGFSTRGICGPAFAHMIDSVRPGYASHKKRLTIPKARRLKNTIFAENFAKYCDAIKMAPDGVSIMLDSWTPKGATSNLLACAITIKQTKTAFCMPYRARALGAEERETGEYICAFALECIDDIRQSGGKISAIISDNAANVKLSRFLAVERMTDMDVAKNEEKNPPGDNGRLVTPILDIGCLSHHHSLLIGDLTGLVRNNKGEVTRTGQFYHLCEISGKARRWQRMPFISRIYQRARGLKIPAVCPIRWGTAISAVCMLVKMWDTIVTVLTELRNEAIWNTLSRESQQATTELAMNLEDEKLRFEAVSYVEAMTPFLDLSQALQSSSLSLFEGMKLVTHTYATAMSNKVFSRISRASIKERLSKAMDGREWVISFDPGNPDLRQPRAIVETISNLRAFCENFSGSTCPVNFAESLPSIMDYFQRSGPHSGYSIELLAAIPPITYWRAHRHACSAFAYIFQTLAVMGSTASLERVFSSCSFVHQTNLKAEHIFRDVFIRWATRQNLKANGVLEGDCLVLDETESFADESSSKGLRSP